MVTHVKVSAIFECSLERAFKTGMLCDLSKVHTGFGPVPKVTHTTDDEHWGKTGSSKKVFVEKSFFHSGGFAFMDRVLERKENQYWKIQVDDFQFWVLGFYKFVGEWHTKQLNVNTVQVEYKYALYSRSIFLRPICWLFGKFVWKRYMNQVLNNVKDMAYNEEPYIFD